MTKDNIRSERIRAGYTQAEAAKKLGISRFRVQRYEANPAITPGSVLLDMSNIFETSTEYLLGLTDDRLPKDAAANV